ncbi:MAG: efflux transporter outer membrane subunit [Planctomycetota bacterium]
MIRRVLCLLLLPACTVGPDYERPDVPVPEAFRGAGPDAAEQARSFGDLGWWEVFQDERLVALIHRALEQNLDLKVTAARILQARARVTVEKSFQLPTVDATGAASLDKTTGSDRPPINESYTAQAGFSLAWELDIWGQYARATEAARARLMAEEEFRRTVTLTLVSDVAGAYFELRELDLELEIATATVASRAEYLSLTRAREEGGVATMMDVRQAEQLYHTAAAAVADTQRRVAQQENLISDLLGGYPGDILRGRKLEDQRFDPSVTPGLTIDLLTRRPDVREAEQVLIAANAGIGEAEARKLPSLVLQGFGGVGASQINGTTFSPLGVFNFIPIINLPLFNGGRLQADVEFNQAVAEEALLRYQQTIIRAFREVSDSLVEVEKQREVREETEATVVAQRDALGLGNLRYERGVTSFLEVLVTERDLFDAELALARARRDEVLSFVQLYRALGGGWQPEPEPDRTP